MTRDYWIYDDWYDNGDKKASEDKSRRSDKHATETETETEGTSMTECDCVLWYEVFGQYEEFSK